MNEFDLCLAWNTDRDVDFVELLDAALRARGLSPLLQVTPVNVEHTVSELENGQIAFRAYLDRAVEDDPRFMPIVEWARDHATLRINPYEKACHTWDKSATHVDLFANLRTPYTIILPPYDKQPELGELDLSPLGPTFTTKPAHGGGGQGVLVLCTTEDQIDVARQEHPDDSYLLQTRVVPAQLAGREAWFRNIYSTGHIYPFWWDTGTHIYVPVTAAEVSHYGLEPLQDLTRRIADICGMHLFTNEIALTPDNDFQVVDYCNDPLDLSLQSKVRNGVTDEVIGYIAEDIADLVQANLVVR